MKNVATRLTGGEMSIIIFRFSITLLLLIPFILHSQPAGVIRQKGFRQRDFIELGHNQVSGGDFSRFSSVNTWWRDSYSVYAGLTMVMPGPNFCGRPGFSIGGYADKNFTLRFFSRPVVDFRVEAFYRNLPFSSRLTEIDAGLLLGIFSSHWEIVAGNNYRAYFLVDGKKNFAGIPFRSDGRISEPRNIMYRITFHLRKISKPWNISFRFTNYDYFLIEQELNPMLNLRWQGNLSQRLSCFIDAWYTSTGFWNEQIDHFGYMLRYGLIWEI